MHDILGKVNLVERSKEIQHQLVIDAGFVISHSTIIGILPVKYVRGRVLTENKYDGECLSNDIR